MIDNTGSAQDPWFPAGDGGPTGTDSGLDRRALERADPALTGRLLRDGTTLVLPIADGQAPIAAPPPQAAAPAPVSAQAAPESEPLALAWRAPEPRDLEHEAYFLGRDNNGIARLAVAVPESAAAPDLLGNGTAPWAGPREVGHRLSAFDQDALLTGIALSRWHDTHRRCPRCGAPAEPSDAGWTRRCTADGSTHFPRTDPAVIMAVVDDAGRVLIANNVAWPPGRFSVLAGFVEPGERLEDSVIREVFEEVGVRVRRLHYFGSQPWPFPASLMLAYFALAENTDLVPAPDEIREARWVSRDEMTTLVADGVVGLPGRLSIARRLLHAWYGGPLAPPQETLWSSR